MNRSRLGALCAALALPILLVGCSAGGAPAAPTVASTTSATKAAAPTTAPVAGSGGGSAACSRLTSAQIQSISGVQVDGGASAAKANTDLGGASSCVWKGPAGPVVTVALFPKTSTVGGAANIDDMGDGSLTVTIPGAKKAVAVSTGGGVILDAETTSGDYVQVLAYHLTTDQAVSLATLVLKS
ncbi:hypothetical protein [Leifsonia poae]|uniref:hypothetical protein n=1 Tax=Leifsonia poae TaxID=110933 RepID=UPI001CBC6EA5|nr:hypothetical protein [Leifsonia poae]